MFHFLHQVIDWIGANWYGGAKGSDGSPSENILHLLVGHILVVVYALLISLAVALPVSLWLGHTGKGGFVAINAANVGRALPSFAVLVLAAQSPLGIGIKPALVALVLLSIPPIMTNTYTAIREVDPDAKEAAVGMGMTGFQVLFQVEIPGSIPLIAAGIKTAAVQAVATAALAGFVAYDCLGTLINLGVSTDDHVVLFVGAVLVVALALITEYGLTWLQRTATPAGILVAQGEAVRRRRRFRRDPVLIDAGLIP